MKPFVIVVGVFLVIAGFAVSRFDLTVSDGMQTAHCGSAFSSPVHGDAAERDSSNGLRSTMNMGVVETHFTDLCAGKKSTFSILAGISGVIGLGLLIEGCFMNTRRPDSNAQRTGCSGPR